MGKNKGPAQATKGKGGKVKEEPKAAVGVDSMEVRHILVEKHGQAMEIIKEINLGKIAFNEAARTYSQDKAGRSGLIGWRRKTELDPDFWEAALQVPEGEFTPEPVKTMFGYHIIMVQGRR